jgi:molecular chaperone GrpE
MEDRYKRARADLDNYRKRSDRELERRVLEQQDEILREWLEVVDSVERALGLQTDHPQLVQGLQAFLDQMEAILGRRGVTRVGEPGERFDPERHEAVGVVPSENLPPGTIVDVARSGYVAGSRVLRPAQVRVARPPTNGS